MGGISNTKKNGRKAGASARRTVLLVLCAVVLIAAGLGLKAALSGKPEVPAPAPSSPELPSPELSSPALPSPEPSSPEPSSPELPSPEPSSTTPPRAEWAPDSYEIHLLLKSDLVLGEDHLLTQEALDAFHVEKSYTLFTLSYFETPERDFYQEGWINRLRLKYEEDDENNFKLTYKKRYSVPGGDLAAAAALAEKDGFDLADKSWEKQIEWGFSGMTLSLSTDAELPAGTVETVAELDPAEAFAMMKNSMPEKERNWKSENWGLDAFASAKAVGPVSLNRYKGKLADRKVDVEVWAFTDMRDDSDHYLTELSFEADDYEDAAAGRELMIGALQDLGILQETDSLKTQKILDAYLAGS